MPPLGVTRGMCDRCLLVSRPLLHGELLPRPKQMQTALTTGFSLGASPLLYRSAAVTPLLLSPAGSLVLLTILQGLFEIRDGSPKMAIFAAISAGHGLGDARNQFP